MVSISMHKIYNNMLCAGYLEDEIELYFLLNYKLDVREKRIGQNEFRNELVDRFGKCVITHSKTFQACHIVPYSDIHNMDVNNGLLLNYQHHAMFDKYMMSINPESLCIEFNYNMVDRDEYFVSSVIGKKINILEQYPRIILYLNRHYNEFLEKN